MKQKTFSVEALTEKAADLNQLAATGNVKETANVVTNIALVLNTQKTDEKSAEDVEESKKVHTYTAIVSGE